MSEVLFAGQVPHWLWLAVGLGLAVAEIVIPGVFLIWMAGGALITGLVVMVVPMPMVGQVGLFAVLALGSVMVGRRWMAAHPVVSDDPDLNLRGNRAIGQIVTVTEAIVAGQGRVAYGDGQWMARGADAPVGARVKITGHEGTVLIVALVD